VGGNLTANVAAAAAASLTAGGLPEQNSPVLSAKAVDFTSEQILITCTAGLLSAKQATRSACPFLN